MTRKATILLVLLPVLAASLSCYSGCGIKSREYYRSMIREGDLGKVRTGMTKGEVRAVLGKPDFEYAENDGRKTSWRYHKGLLQSEYVYLYFDDQDRLTAVETIIR